jgi:crooked neck
MEEIVLNKREHFYLELLEKNPSNYDYWIDLIRLVEEGRDEEKIRDTYERAISNVPEDLEKQAWRRYVYLWMLYAIWEENEEWIEKAEEVLEKILLLIPHKLFSFSKLWIMTAHFYVWQNNFSKARKVFGQAIGWCPKLRIFDAYVEMELQLG